jgi:hypothetical protein
VLVPKGTYRFEARLKAEGITSKEEGASVRISGIRNTTRLDGSFDWKTVGHEFTISADLQEITMVVELRATAGRLLIDPNARIVRLK